MTRHPDFYLFLFGGYKIIRIFETTSRKSSRSKILKIIWYFTHLFVSLHYGISVTEIP